MIRVGLLGCAHVHAAVYVSAFRGAELGAEPVAIYDGDAARSAAFAQANGLDIAHDPEELCRMVDAVIVVAEHVHYPELVAAAAAAGRPVLLEKPLGATTADCRLLLSSPAWLSVSFPVRYAPPVVRAKHVLDRGELGALVAMSGANRGPYPGGFFGTKSLAGGGALIDHVVHVADTLRYLTGCEYSTVYAEAGHFREVGDVEDCAQLVATTTDGAWASIDSSWSRPPGMSGALDFEMTMWFERGRLHLDAFARRAMLVGPDGAIAFDDYGRGMNEEMLADWIEAISTGGPPPIPAIEGGKATALALAASRSVETGEVTSVRGILE